MATKTAFANPVNQIVHQMMRIISLTSVSFATISQIFLSSYCDILFASTYYVDSPSHPSIQSWVLRLGHERWLRKFHGHSKAWRSGQQIERFLLQDRCPKYSHSLVCISGSAVLSQLRERSCYMLTTNHLHIDCCVDCVGCDRKWIHQITKSLANLEFTSMG